MRSKKIAEAYKSLNDALVEALKTSGDLHDGRIEAAFRAVPRHLFLPGVAPEQVYADEAIAIKRDTDRSVLSLSSQPGMIARMLTQLVAEPGDNVLEIGTGTGYSAALLQQIVGPTGKVTSIELDKDLVRQANDNLQRLGLSSVVAVVHGDGAAGYAPRAAYDRIIAWTRIWDVPPAWLNQLKPDGVLVAPLWVESMQFSGAFRLQRDGSLYSECNLPCSFVRLRGPAAGPRVYKRLASRPLALVSSAINQLDVAALQALLGDDATRAYIGKPLTASDYWNGFLPYFMLNLPPGTILAQYNILENMPTFGIDDDGFALIMPGSACFVPLHGAGSLFCFAGSDALLAVQDAVTAWDAAGRPTAEQLRLRLTPAARAGAVEPEVHVYHRRDHVLQVWLAQGQAS